MCLIMHIMMGFCAFYNTLYAKGYNNALFGVIISDRV